MKLKKTSFHLREFAESLNLSTFVDYRKSLELNISLWLTHWSFYIKLVRLKTSRRLRRVRECWPVLFKCSDRDIQYSQKMEVFTVQLI